MSNGTILRSRKRRMGKASVALEGRESKSSTKTLTTVSGRTRVTERVRGDSWPSVDRIAAATACGDRRLVSPMLGTTTPGGSHAALECVACHVDIKEVPHAEKLARVDCGLCHSDEQSQYAASVHGRKAAQNDPYAPNCKLCHGTHDI